MYPPNTFTGANLDRAGDGRRVDTDWVETLAGFVGPGESLEEAVAREVTGALPAALFPRCPIRASFNHERVFCEKGGWTWRVGTGRSY